MFDWISPFTFATAIALFAVTWGTSGPKRRPVVALCGLIALAFSLTGRFFATPGIVGATVGLLTDFGIAAVASGLYLARRRQRPKALISLGVLLLVASIFVKTTASIVASMLADEVDSAAFVEGEFLLELGPDDSIEEVEPILDAWNASAVAAFPTLTLADDENLAQYYVVQADPGVVADLSDALRADTENVDTVEPNFVVALDPPARGGARVTTPLRSSPLADDPRIGEQWWFQTLGFDEVHRTVAEGNLEPVRKAVVAILDTGVDTRHEDLESAYGGSAPAKDGNGHGTHCAGIAGAVANNGRGIATLNWEGRFIDLRSYQVLNESGFGTSQGIAQGIARAAQDGADVISLSLGSWAPRAPKVQRDAVAYALRQGAVVVAAAGNSNQDAREHAPSNIEGVISVAAVDSEGRKASFSNWNAGLARPLSAPGVDILSSKPNGLYARHNGTSMATPVVAGLAGFLRSLDPDLSADAIYDILSRTARPSADAGRIGPIVHAGRAVNAVVERESAPTLP